MAFVIRVVTPCGVFDVFRHMEGTPGLHLQGVVVQKKNYGASGQTQCSTWCKNPTDNQNLDSTQL
jgi:hypothetical protein